MVKKILLDGSACTKCVQAEQILKKRGLWNYVNHLVLAEEGHPDSEGMRLAKKHAVDLAPFFIVENNGREKIYTRLLEFIRSELQEHSRPSSAVEYKNKLPQEILADAQNRYGASLAIAFSGAEDVILIDMASRNAAPFSVFCIDTGRLHPETYVFIDRVRDHYGIEIEVFTPSPELLEPFVREKGMTSFYQDGHHECCSIRKVEPLKRALKGRKAWVTGLRRDQSPATRKNLTVEENDDAEHFLVKFNPLLNWHSSDVWEYIRTHSVPYNTLHDAGYISIGCAPCTRVLRPGEHERAARWWWEDATQRECGLHLKD